MPIMTSLLSYYPLALGLIYSGVAGMPATRAMMFQQLPTAGLPFHFQRWAEFGFRVRPSSTIWTRNPLGYRPSPHLGALESADLRWRVQPTSSLVALMSGPPLGRQRNAPDHASGVRERTSGIALRPERGTIAWTPTATNGWLPLTSCGCADPAGAGRQVANCADGSFAAVSIIYRDGASTSGGCEWRSWHDAGDFAPVVDALVAE